MQNTEQNTPTQKPRPGFIANVMPTLGRTGEFIYFFLAGEVTVVEHANRFKGLLGLPYKPVEAGEKHGYTPRTGLHAKVRIGLSQDGQWVTVYLPGNLGKICNHVNAYKHIFGIAYEKKSQDQAQASA